MVITSNEIRDTTVAFTYHNLGWYYKYVDQPEQAIQTHTKALALRKRMKPAQPLAIAESYESLANVYRYTYYDYNTAEEYYSKALFLYDQQPETSKKIRFNTLYNLSTTNRLKQNYEKALEFGFKALALAEELSSADQEISYHVLGNILHSQHHSEKAISFYNRAINLASKKAEKGFNPHLPKLYNNLGLAYLDIDSTKTAVQILKKSLSMCNTFALRVIEADKADAYEYLGKAYTQMSRFDSAGLYYRRGLRLSRRTYGEKNWQTSETLEDIAEFHEKQHHFRFDPNLLSASFDCWRAGI